MAEAFDLASALKASSFKLQSFQAKGKINGFRPQAAELLSFVKSDKRKVTKEKRLFVNQVPASAELPRACATRDILSRWRTAHIHVRRPSGVRLLTRVTSLAALEDRLGFKLKAELS